VIEVPLQGLAIEVENDQWIGRCDELGIQVDGLTAEEAGEKLNAMIRKVAGGYDLPDSMLAPEAYDTKTRLIESGWIPPQRRDPRPCETPPSSGSCATIPCPPPVIDEAPATSRCPVSAELAAYSVRPVSVDVAPRSHHS